MVYTCSVPFCKGNYKTGPKVSVYSFPKDKELHQKWITSIGRKDFQPNKNSRVCELHFHEEDFITEARGFDEKTGKVLTAPLPVKRLKATAFPSIFRGYPDYCSKISRTQRDGPQQKRELREEAAISQAIKASIKEKERYEESRRFASLQELDSKVCELHFEPSQILREASAYDPKTGRTLTAPLRIPHLKKGAVPTLRLPPPGSVLKQRMDPRKLANFRQKNKPKEKALRGGTEETVESQLVKLLQVRLGAEYQSVVETPQYTLIVQEEPPESVGEAPRLMIEKVLGAKELLSSSIISSSSSSCSSSNSSSLPSTSSMSSLGHSQPVPENGLPIANPDSTHVDQTLATDVTNKPIPKRKINDTEPGTSGASPGATQVKLRRCPKRPMPSEGNNKLKLHPPSGTSRKSTGRSTLPTQNGEDAARGMFQSLFDSSENNPLFGSRTTERPGDLFDVFADFIADKLREMDWDDCAYSLRGILDIVFKAGRVQHGSGVKSDISNPNTSPESSDQE